MSLPPDDRDYSRGPPPGGARNGPRAEREPDLPVMPASPGLLAPVPVPRPIIHLRSEGSGLIRAMVGVMRRVKEIRKEGYNKEAKYFFVYVGDVYAALQDAFVEEGIIISQREVERKIVQKVLAMRFEFDVYRDDEWIVNFASHTGACRFEFKSGATDDKAFNKALTSVSKYVLLTTFKIPADDHNTERVSDGDADSQGPNHDPGRDERDDRRPDERRSDDRARERGRDERDERARDDERPRGGERTGRDGFTYGPSSSLPSDYGAGTGEERPRDTRSPADGPPFGERAGTVANPPDSPQERDFRKRVSEFTHKLRSAMNLDEAEGVWLGEDGRLLNEMSDNTYNFLRDEFQTRWNRWPGQR